MPSSTPEELRCPTCGARQSPSDTCRRCKSDLSMLRAALASLARHRRDAVEALGAGRPDAALRHARRCHELRPGPESHRLLAICHLVLGDWAEAVASARAAERFPHG